MQCSNFMVRLLSLGVQHIHTGDKQMSAKPHPENQNEDRLSKDAKALAIAIAGTPIVLWILIRIFVI